MSCAYCWPGNCCGGPNCLSPGKPRAAANVLETQHPLVDAADMISKKEAALKRLRETVDRDRSPEYECCAVRVSDLRIALEAAAKGRAEERERCATIADRFTCGLCGMDGQVSGAIRSAP